ncbi:MAG TPA: ankyrin repeat domain-containing protein [Bryobacteraceae bacterium]|nr:ankyrin repeat domain-containing protein [Bryobacteraceae bacterium]
MKQVIENGDAKALRRILSRDPAQANALIRWGTNDSIRTHPLHYVSDLLFEKKLPKTRALPLIDALIQAGADLDFQPKAKSDTPLIGAASLGAEEVGLRLLEAGANPSRRGIFGETALHWAALLGEAKLARKLIPGANLELKDEKYNSTPLGWAIHGISSPPAGSHGDQLKVAKLLIAAGAKPDAQ